MRAIGAADVAGRKRRVLRIAAKLVVY